MIKKIKEFKKYCKKENIKIITWLNIKNLNLIKKYFKKKYLNINLIMKSISDISYCFFFNGNRGIEVLKVFNKKFKNK